MIKKEFLSYVLIKKNDKDRLVGSGNYKILVGRTHTSLALFSRSKWKMKINKVAVRNTLQKSEGPHLLWRFSRCQVQSGADEPPIFLMPAGRHFCLGWKQQRVTAQLSRGGCEVSAPQSLTTTTSCTHTPCSASRVFIVVGLWPWETLAFRISLKFHYSFLSAPSFILCLFIGILL